MTVIKASSALSEGAEAATTPVNSETLTAIADWRDTTVIHDETDDGLDLRPRYGAVWHGQKSWNGVAILARGADQVCARGAPR